MSSQALIPNPIIQPTQLLSNLASGQLLKVKGAKGSAVILCRPHYAEIIGPGASIGGMLDLDVRQIIPIGEVTFQAPESREDQQKAFVMRQKWCNSVQKMIKNHDSALERAFLMLEKLKQYSGLQAVNALSDDIIAQLVAVLPKTVALARSYKNHQSVNSDQLIVDSDQLTVNSKQLAISSK
jgi:hypothetical protein